MNESNENFTLETCDLLRVCLHVALRILSTSTGLPELCPHLSPISALLAGFCLGSRGPRYVLSFICIAGTSVFS